MHRQHIAFADELPETSTSTTSSTSSTGTTTTRAKVTIDAGRAYWFVRRLAEEAVRNLTSGLAESVKAEVRNLTSGIAESAKAEVRNLTSGLAESAKEGAQDAARNSTVIPFIL